MQFNEETYKSVATIVHLLQRQFQKHPTTEQDKEIYQKRINFLIDDLFTKSDLLSAEAQQIPEKKTEIEKPLSTSISASPASELTQLKKKYADEIYIAFRSMQVQITSLQFEINRRFGKYKLIIGLLAILYLVVLTIVILKFNFGDVEPLLAIAASIPLVAGILYVIKNGRSFSLAEFFERKKTAIQKDVFLKYNFDEERYRQLESIATETSAFRTL